MGKQKWSQKLLFSVRIFSHVGRFKHSMAACKQSVAAWNPSIHQSLLSFSSCSQVSEATSNSTSKLYSYKLMLETFMVLWMKMQVGLCRLRVCKCMRLVTRSVMYTNQVIVFYVLYIYADEEFSDTLEKVHEVLYQCGVPLYHLFLVLSITITECCYFKRTSKFIINLCFMNSNVFIWIH